MDKAQEFNHTIEDLPNGKVRLIVYNGPDNSRSVHDFKDYKHLEAYIRKATHDHGIDVV
jgi:hypothetical protein